MLVAPTTRVRHGVLAFLFVFSFLTIVDRVAISGAKSSMAAELGIGDVAFGFIFGVFALGYALGQVPSGWAADRYGPRAFLAAIVIAWSLFTGLTALTAAVPMLMAVRLLFGLAEAGIYPTASRAIYSWIPPHDRGRAQGLLFIGSRLGAAFGLSVVSAAIAVFGWRGTFWALAAAGVLLALVWHAWFRNTPDEKPGVSSSELAYIRAGRAVETAAVADDGRSLWDANAVLLGVQYFASNFTFFIAFTWLLPYLQSRYALSPAEAGAYASVPLYFGALGNWLSGSLVDAIYRPRLPARVPARAGDGRLRARHRRPARRALDVVGGWRHRLFLAGDAGRGHDAQSELDELPGPGRTPHGSAVGRDEHGGQPRIVRELDHLPGAARGHRERRNLLLRGSSAEPPRDRLLVADSPAPCVTRTLLWRSPCRQA